MIAEKGVQSLTSLRQARNREGITDRFDDPMVCPTMMQPQIHSFARVRRRRSSLCRLSWWTEDIAPNESL